MEEESGLKRFTFYLVVSYASIMSVVVLSVLIILRFKIDIPAMLILIGYTVSMIFRISISIFIENVAWLSTVADLMVWTCLFSFLFQMIVIHDKILSQTREEFLKRRKRNKIEMSIILFFYVFLVYGIEFFIDVNQNTRLVDILIIVRSVSKMIADAYCFATFMMVFIYFIKRKIEVSRVRGKDSMTCISKFAVVYTLT
jgi:hypothetical protein